MSSKEPPSLKRRESRSGTRKVSSLSAEQLERKRANDREAQRSIRQRTKNNIEQLEAQVSSLQSQIEEMRLRTDRYDEVVQQNATLEDEVSRLKRLIASFTGRPEFAGSSEQMAPFQSGWPLEEVPNNASPIIPTTGLLLSPHFTEASQSRTSSALSSSSRASHPRDWQQPYPSTRSPSLGDSSEDFPNHLDPYVIDGQVHQGSRILPTSIPNSAPQIGFSATSAPPQVESSFAQFPYSNRSLSMSNAIPVNQPAPYSQSIQSQRDSTFTYPWGAQS
jgi:TolA-binding protein